MRTFLKHIVNGCLKPINLRVVRFNKDTFSGVNLFEDLQKLINTDSPVCLDVGANTGQTIENLLEAFRTPYIYAFEPSTRTFQILKQKELSGRIFLYNFALGKEKQSREFINYNESRLSSFLPLDSDEANRFREVGEHSKEIVEVETVDRFLRQEHIKEVDLLKIDTQGFDLEVLIGAKNALQNGVVRNVLIELNFVKMYEGQCSPEATIRFLREHGLSLIDYYEKVRQKYSLAWCTALFGQN